MVTLFAIRATNSGVPNLFEIFRTLLTVKLDADEQRFVDEVRERWKTQGRSLKWPEVKRLNAIIERHEHG